MSHIDSFKHELVGYLGFISVYHPLEDIDGDFECTTNQLVIGGGSGEHPALVIESLVHAVALFLKEEIPNIKKLRHWESIIAPYLNKISSELLTYYEWTEETHKEFAEMSKSDTLPCQRMGHEIDDWVILGIGEFVFFSLPHLANEIMSQLDNPYEEFRHMRYNNIMVVPPNFPVYSNGGNMFFKK